jgi:hypothetical protein
MEIKVERHEAQHAADLVVHDGQKHGESREQQRFRWAWAELPSQQRLVAG